jgi:hypothetical protein
MLQPVQDLNLLACAGSAFLRQHHPRDRERDFAIEADPSGKYVHRLRTDIPFGSVDRNQIRL